jgi:glycosyltransferase involved in cell wall biosynthesis
MKVGFVSRRFGHHGRHSGYQLLAESWPGEKTVHFLPDNSMLPRIAALRRVFSSVLETRKSLAKRDVRRSALRDGVDILHVLYGESDLPFPTPLAGAKLVASIHQPVSHLRRNTGRIELLKRQLQNVDLTIALSSEQKSFLRELLPRKRVESVPHGVDTEFFQPTGEPRERIVLVSCGWYRDLGFAREVIRELAERDPSLRFRAYGGGASQLAGAVPQLKVLAGLSDEELRHEYCTCGLMLLPLKEAVANNALLEAISCGTVVVAPALPAVSEYLGATATCYEPGHLPAEVADLTYRLLERPIAGSALRARALEFDWQTVARRMLEQYDRICG